MKKERAVTLVELIVSIAIFAMVALGLIIVLNYTRGSIEIFQTTSSLEEEIQNALNVMTNELRQTRAAKITAGPVNADGLWYNSISFAIPYDIDSDADIINATGAMEWSDQNPQNWTVSYAFSGTQLRRTAGDNRNPILANNITSVSFRRQIATPGLIDVSVSGQMTTYLNRTVQISITDSVEMRN